jgi:hypothetical protein
LELATDWLAFHVVSDARSWAAALSALSLVAMSFRPVWRAWTCDLRVSSSAFACRSMLSS